MPIYVYEIVQPDGSAGESFEVDQPMTAAPLTAHPETGEPVRRVYLPPGLAIRYSDGAAKQRLTNENLAAKGFTKYERDKVTGQYHRVAGKEGPSVIQRP